MKKLIKVKKIILISILVLITIILSMICVAYYIEAKIKTPECKSITKDESHANAGCLILFENKVILVKQAMTGKISIPGGTKKLGENAPCTAHRETFEETGVDVIIEEKIQKFGNNFILYKCKPLNHPNLKYSKFLEIKEIKLLDLKELKNMSEKEFRFPNQAQTIIQFLEKHQQPF